MPLVLTLTIEVVMKLSTTFFLLVILATNLSGCATPLGYRYGTNLGIAGTAIGAAAGNLPGAIIGGAAGTIIGGLFGDLTDRAVQSGGVTEGYYDTYRLRAVPHWRSPRCFDVEEIVLDYDGYVINRYWRTVCR